MEKVLEYAKKMLAEQGLGLVITNLSRTKVYYAIEGGYWWKKISTKYPEVVKKRMEGDILVYDEEENVMYLFDEYGLELERV